MTNRSCKRCQTRKVRLRPTTVDRVNLSGVQIKCSRTTPCRSCSAAGADCEFRAHDWKRSPISREHVTALEARIAALESLLSSIKSSRGHEREMVIANIDVVGHQPTATDQVQASVHVSDLFLQEMRGCWDGDRTGMSSDNFPGR